VNANQPVQSRGWRDLAVTPCLPRLTRLPRRPTKERKKRQVSVRAESSPARRRGLELAGTWFLRPGPIGNRRVPLNRARSSTTREWGERASDQPAAKGRCVVARSLKGPSGGVDRTVTLGCVPGRDARNRSSPNCGHSGRRGTTHVARARAFPDAPPSGSSGVKSMKVLRAGRDGFAPFLCRGSART